MLMTILSPDMLKFSREGFKIERLKFKYFSIKKYLQMLYKNFYKYFECKNLFNLSY